MATKKRALADNESLRSTLAGLQPTVTTSQAPNPAYADYQNNVQAGQTGPPQATDPTLNELQGGQPGQQGLEYPSYQGQEPPATIPQTTTTPADPMKAIFDHAMKIGALDTAKNAIDMQALVRASTPDKVKSDEALKELGTFTSALKHVKELKQAGILNQGMLDGILGMLPDSLKAKFPNGIKQSDFNNDGSLEVKDAQGNVIAHWAVSPDGTKTELVKQDKALETWSAPYETNVGGKKVMVQKSSHGKVQAVASDTSTTVKVMTGKGSMTQGAVDMAADQYLLTGQMPALGMGGAAQKMAILNRAAEKAQEQGLDARGIQGQINEIKASGGALKNDEKQYDMMHKAELQAQGAAKLLRESSKNYGRTNVKFVNSIEALGREAVNDPKLADLQMKLLAFGREYYKVTTNAYASAAELSIGAQAAADKMLNASNSYAALEAKINAAEQEMGNTNKTFLQTIKERKGQIRGGGPAQPAPGNRPLPKF